MARVLVASASLGVGQFVHVERLSWRDWPADAVVAAHVTSEEAEKADFAGAVVRTAMAPGDPFSPGKIVQPGERGFLAAVLKPGMRAAAVPVNAVSGASGLIFPGDRVDLILVQEIDEEGAGAARRMAGETVLRDLRVLAVDQRLSDPAPGVDGELPMARTVTLEVTPRQAERVALARDMGSLALSLRSLAVPEEEAAETPARVGPTWAGDVSKALGASDGGGERRSLLIYRGSETEERSR
jgi:pilus assembly protein CpaB